MRSEVSSFSDRKQRSSMKNSAPQRRKPTPRSSVNRLRVRILPFLEVEGEGVIPVVGAFVLCLIVVGRGAELSAQGGGVKARGAGNGPCRFGRDDRWSDVVADTDVAHISWDECRPTIYAEDRPSDCQGRLDLSRSARAGDGWAVALHARPNQTGRGDRRREERQCARR